MKISLYPVFLGFSLVMAYWASLPKEEGSSERELWFEVKDSDAYHIKYNEEKLIASIDSKGWVVLENVKDNIPMPPDTFKANFYLKNVLDKVLTIYAEKVIGPAKDLNLSDYELDSDKKSIEINVNGNLHAFIIGKASFQSSNIYLLDKAKDIVILVDKEPFDFLRNPKERLFESKPYNFKLEDDVTSAKLVANEKSRTIVKGRDDKGKLIWTLANSTEALAAEGSWISNFLKLKLNSYATKLELNALEKLPSILSVEFLNGDRNIEKIEIFKWANAASDPGTYWIKSKYLGSFGIVDSTKAETIIQDIKGLL